jgi:hypothetical protein
MQEETVMAEKAKGKAPRMHDPWAFHPNCDCNGERLCAVHCAFSDTVEAELVHLDLLLDLPQYAHLRGTDDMEGWFNTLSVVGWGPADISAPRKTMQVVREWIQKHSNCTHDHNRDDDER